MLFRSIDEIISSTTHKLGYVDIYSRICSIANDSYKKLMESAKEAKAIGSITNDQYKRYREFMRGMLPQHNMTERVSIMNLRSFANFYKLRSKPDAQPEIRIVAEKMLKAIEENKVAPIAIEALKRNNWVI